MIKIAASRFGMIRSGFIILLMMNIPGICSYVPMVDSLLGIETLEQNPIEKEQFSFEPNGVKPKDTLLINALNLINNGAYDTAISMAGKYLKQFPNSVAGNEIMGTGLALKGNFEEGIKFLRKALELNPKECSALTKIGDIYFAEKKFKVARDYFNKAVECSPTENRAHQRLGMLCEQEKDYRGAIEHYEKGIFGTAPSYIGIKVNLANLYNSSRQYEKTLKLLQGVVTPNVKNIFAHMALGNAYLGMQKSAEAVHEFQIVRELAPKDPRASLLLGIGYIAANDLVNSEKCLLEAVSLNPQSVQAYVQLAENYKAAQKYDKAMECYTKLEKLKQNLLAKKGIADIYLKQKDIPKAVTVYEDLLRSKTADPETYDLLITACQSSGQLDKAEKYALELQSRFPKDPFSYYRLGIYYSFAMKYKEATVQLKKALLMAPDDPIILKALSLTYSRLGNYANAIDYARKIITIHPDDIDDRFYYASLLQEKNDTTAVEEYRKILIRNPEHIFTLNNLSMLLMEKGNYTEALKYAEKASYLDNQNGNILDTYGWVLYKNNNKTKSLLMLQKAQSLLPENPSLLYHLASVYAALGKKTEAKEILTKLLALKTNFKQRSDAEALFEKL